MGMLKGIMKNRNAQKSPKSFYDPTDKFTKIYVGNMTYDMAEGDINKLFTKYGKVGKIQVIRDPETNKSKGIAFLQMYNREHALTAIDKLNGSEVNGRTLKVSIAQEREKLQKKPKQKVVKTQTKEEKPRKQRRRKFNFDFSPQSNAR
ncbi:MAG: hypothetical protein CME62_14060 [Halobacteriovoraceae bacterium]|nr:hypothetical protein [Halobacteriovoraceae bacterium]|tara:strand:+ start:9128 stop:9571 length:444 start_codon:yes stop_codon:yes gene_type:complete